MLIMVMHILYCVVVIHCIMIQNAIITTDIVLYELKILQNMRLDSGMHVNHLNISSFTLGM